MLLRRSLSSGRHRPLLPGPCQPHQDPASPRTGEVRGHLRQRKPAKIKWTDLFRNSDISCNFAQLATNKWLTIMIISRVKDQIICTVNSPPSRRTCRRLQSGTASKFWQLRSRTRNSRRNWPKSKKPTPNDSSNRTMRKPPSRNSSKSSNRPLMSVPRNWMRAFRRCSSQTANSRSPSPLWLPRTRRPPKTSTPPKTTPGAATLRAQIQRRRHRHRCHHRSRHHHGRPNSHHLLNNIVYYDSRLIIKTL